MTLLCDDLGGSPKKSPILADGGSVVHEAHMKRKVVAACSSKSILQHCKLSVNLQLLRVSSAISPFHEAMPTLSQKTTKRNLPPLA